MMALTDSKVRKTLNVPEVAHILGLSLGSCYAAVRQGRIACIRVGERVVVPTAVIEKLLGHQLDAESLEQARRAVVAQRRREFERRYGHGRKR